MINGCLSNMYWVYRGIRQGNLLSCLLFNLVSELLSTMIHGSDRLQGFDVPKSGEQLKARFFADDSTAYLSNDDGFELLQKLLDT